MAIKQLDETGFTCVTHFRDKLVAETRVEYRECGIPCDDHGVPIPGYRVEFLCWLARRAWSENLTNAVALGKEKSHLAAAEALNEKVASMRRGEVATGGGGGPRLSPWEVEQRAFVARWFIARGVQSKKADELSKAFDDAIAYAAKVIVQDDSDDMQSRIKAKWTAEIQRRVDELTATPDF